jgi:hypothetical protein
MKGYFYISGERQIEINREQAESVAQDDGIKNTDEYFTEIESGAYGTGDVLVARNIYYGEIED